MMADRPSARRILLTLSYDGTGYAGWQRQANALAVQEVLEKALHRATGEAMGVTGASRTDAGVHALGQAAHFDTSCSIPPEKFSFVLNTMLPPDIRVLFSRQVPNDFHARFSAKGKTYTYRIHNAPHASALMRSMSAHVPVPLDEAAMDEAAQLIVGTHDFAAFQASGGTAKTTLRTITLAHVMRQGQAVVLVVSGNAFLYNMVRILAGTLIEIGQGALEASSLSKAIETGNRLLLGPTAPARGLELTEVMYDL